MTAPRAVADLVAYCLRSNLRLRQALALHDQLYMADAVRIEGGNITRAAERAGLNRDAVHRLHTRHTIEKEPDDA